MRVTIDSRFKVEVGNKKFVIHKVEKHNMISPQYQDLLNALLTSGSSANMGFLPQGKYQPPSQVYFFLENTQQSTPLPVRLQATLESFNENFNTMSTYSCSPSLGSCNLQSMTFTLKYTAVDESSNSYSFNLIALNATMPSYGEYNVALTQTNTITKGSSDFLSLSWEATVTIESYGIFYLPGCSDPTFKMNYHVNLNGYQPLLCVNLPYIIVALTLIPYNQIPQNSFLYKQVNNLLQILGISSSSGIGLPTEQLNFQGVQYYVIGYTAYPISQPYSITNKRQSNIIYIFLLYGVNNNYFIYTLAQTQYLNYNTEYVPTLTINFTTE